MVQTRSQRCYQVFQQTIENPCVLSLITDRLDAQDLVCFKQVSKDHRFNDVIDHQLEMMKNERMRRKEVIDILQERIQRSTEVDSGKPRIPIILGVYDILCENKWLLDFSQLKDKIYAKLIEFTKDPLFRDHGVKYFEPLFGLPEPKSYYNSKTGLSQFGTIGMDGNFILLK
jgi:hypothetical protein